MKPWYYKVFTFIVSINLLFQSFRPVYDWFIHISSADTPGPNSFVGYALIVLVSVILFAISFGTVAWVYYLAQPEDQQDGFWHKVFGDY